MKAKVGFFGETRDYAERHIVCVKCIEFRRRSKSYISIFRHIYNKQGKFSLAVCGLYTF